MQSVTIIIIVVCFCCFFGFCFCSLVICSGIMSDQEKRLHYVVVSTSFVTLIHMVM